MKTWIASVATLSTLIGFAPAPSRADHLSDIDELACLLLEQSADACREIRYVYVGTPNYRHLYADTYDLYRQADRIHELVHRRAALAEIYAAIGELDELYHHVEELLAETRSRTGGIGHHGSHGRFHHVHFGRGSTYHLRRLNARIADMGETIHALGDMVDAGSHPGRGRVVEPPLSPDALPGAVPSFGPALPIRPAGPTFPTAGRRAIQFGKRDGLSFTLYLGR